MVVVVLWLYRDTALRMVALWGDAETFAHGYMVPVIVAWLLWRKREAFMAHAPSFAPTPSALFVVAAAALVWLVGDVAAVNPASQFALVAMLVLSVPAVAGWPAARSILFPLCFLFFAVPFGDFLLPTLMARTADFTVMALRVSGIPVFRDGQQFVIPSGTWSVVEACSGVRYLLASLMVGALFAYLNYRSMRRRLLFMGVAIVVPIVANWLRAYMIVMIGHLSGNRLAVDVDHVLYGWVFFGIVIGTMFLIGARWADTPADDEVVAVGLGEAASAAGARPVWLAMAAMAVVLALPLLLLQRLVATENHSPPVLVAPPLADTVKVAQAQADSLPKWTPSFGNPAATFEQRYNVQGRAIGLYLAYYRNQGPTRKLVSASNALVRSNDSTWNQPESGTRSIAMGGRIVTFKTARLRHAVALSDGASLVAWQVYWVNGRFEASDASAKLWGAWQRLTGGGDDGAVIVIYGQERERGDADALLEGFLSSHLMAIETQLRKTRDAD